MNTEEISNEYTPAISLKISEETILYKSSYAV